MWTIYWFGWSARAQEQHGLEETARRAFRAFCDREGKIAMLYDPDGQLTDWVTPIPGRERMLAAARAVQLPTECVCGRPAWVGMKCICGEIVKDVSSALDR